MSNEKRLLTESETESEQGAFMAAVVIGVPIIAVMLVVFGPEVKGPEAREAYYQAKLECRQAGGSYEFFGPKGYHCIGGE